MNRKIKHFINVLFLIVSCTSIYGQQPTALETLSKVEAYYKTIKNFDFDVEYKMYRGYTGNHLTESYKGTMYKNGNVLQVIILGSEVLQFPEAKIIINDKNKTISYSKLMQNGTQQTPVDISLFLKFYKESTTSFVGNTLIHEMILKNNTINMPYNRVIMYINKNTYALEKQVLFLTTKVPFNGEKGKKDDAARMEISFKQKPKQKPKPKPLKLKDYVLIGINNKISLSKAYSTYTLIDQTNL
ncbi:hypothetical protein [uncultured Algibacter sp.]|uniref:hypothetical protein n=1 Tax=uncultured Algibacter sp. TaxID=298659 RepID=UPI00321634B3